jgi:hypothetical protein
MDKESLVAKRDAVVAEINEKIRRVKELTDALEQYKAAILVDRGRADALDSIIRELTDEAGSSPSEES